MKRLSNLTSTPTCKRWIIYCVSFISVFFIGIAIDLACGPEPDPYDYYVSFFHNNLQKNDSYAPFYFNGYTFLNGYTNDLDGDAQNAQRRVNIKEWVSYLGKGDAYNNAYKIFYGLDAKTDSIYFRNYSKRKLPDSIKNNAFIKALVQNKKAFAYFLLSKKTEPLVNSSFDDRWNAVQFDKNKLHRFAGEYIKMGMLTNSRFLRLRCFFQAQRLLHYGGFTKEASDFYDKLIIPIHSKSQVIGLTLSLKAGEENILKHDIKAAYLYSKVFAGYPELRIRAYNDFISTKVPISKIIKLAENNKEKGFIYGMKGFNDHQITLTALKQLYRVDPKSELLSVLLTREINKIEEQYLTPRLNGDGYYSNIGYWSYVKSDSLTSAYVNYIPRLKNFCSELATEKRYPEPALGYLGSAYLSWITGDSKTGLTLLDRISDNGIRGKLRDEKQMIKLLLLSQNIKKVDSVSEQKILPSLLWLEQKVKQETSIKYRKDVGWSGYALKYYSASSRDFYAKVLAKVYLSQKDTAMAALCILKSERTIYPANTYFERSHELGFALPAFWQTSLHSRSLEKIIKWRYIDAKRPFLKLLMESDDKNIKAEFYELLGTIYLREHKYAKAVKALSTIKASRLNQSIIVSLDTTSLFVNPFIDKLNDYPLAHEKQQLKAYNKLAFAMKMANLEKKIKSNPQKAPAYYYEMAKGLYNTSYYGNAWFYTAYSWTSSDIVSENHLYYDGDYLKVKTAERHFLKASDLSKNNEFKARCIFMAAKCRQNQIRVPVFNPEYAKWRKYRDDSDSANRVFYIMAKRNPYFKTLQKNYSKTSFYKIAVGECSYFRDFLAANSEMKSQLKTKTK